MAYTDEELQQITEAVRNTLVNEGTDTQAVTEATDISLVANLLGHDSSGELLRITPSNIHKDIIARIQGTSENSTAMRDPFKFAGSYITATLGDLREWLDSLHGTDSTLDNRGVYRAILNGSVIDIVSSPIDYATERYLQVVRGRVSLDSSGLLTFSNEYHIFERQYTSTDGWSAWRVAAGANTIENLNSSIENLNRSAVQYDSFEAVAQEDSVEVGYDTIEGEDASSFVIPSATDTTAGVMSAEDKVALDEIPDLIAASIESGRKLALRDLFVAASAEYNDTSTDITKTAPWGESVTHKAGHYYLNGLGDITEEDMLTIYNEKDRLMMLGGRIRAAQSVKVRTYILPKATTVVSNFYNMDSPRLCFADNSNLEVLMFSNTFEPSSSNDIPILQNGRADYFLYRNSKLKYVSALNVENVTNWGTGAAGAFYGCNSLIEILLFRLKANVEFAQSPNISKRSVLYMIKNSTTTSDITITLHADAYAELANNADIKAALEAQPLITLASA